MKITVTSQMTAMYAMRDGAHTHYISLIGPEDACYKLPENHLMLRFHDVEAVTPGCVAPTIDDVRTIIEFAKALPEDADLLIHCHAGISRSTAAAIGICCLNGMSPADALQHVRDTREAMLKPGYMVLPNRRIIRCFDKELGLNGELEKVVQTYYEGLPLIGVTTLPNRGGWNTTS